MKTGKSFDNHVRLAIRRRFLCRGVIVVAGVTLGLGPISAEDSAPLQASRQPRPVRLLLIGGPPDGHPKGSHEFMAGLRVISKCLEGVDGLQTTIVQADERWSEGPKLMESAEGIVMFRCQGARWMHGDPERLIAFERFAERGGACVALHFGMVSLDADFVDRFVNLFGGCHGGPNRKHSICDVTALVVDAGHPICRGIDNFRVRDEFYYQLHFAKAPAKITPLIQAEIEGNVETIGWAWERANGGRSFGFTGLHFHDNWRLSECRRLVAQAILWTLKLPIPEGGVSVDVPDEMLRVP